MTKDRVKYLPYSIKAILNQTFKNFEFLILDNNSVDETSKYINKIKDDRLVYIKLPDGYSNFENFYKSVYLSTTKYVLVTHDDDILEKNFLSSQIEFLNKNKNLNLIATNVSLIDEYGHRLNSKLYKTEGNIVFKKGEYFKKFLEEKFWLPTPTFFLNREVALNCIKSEKIDYAILKNIKHEKNKLYCSGTPSGDIELACLINQYGPIGYISKPLLRYRQHRIQEHKKISGKENLHQLTKNLNKIINYNRKLAFLKPLLIANDHKYKIEKAFFTHGKEKLNTKLIYKLNKIIEELRVKIKYKKRNLDPLVPINILCLLIHCPRIYTKKTFNKITDSTSDNHMINIYRNWQQTIYNKLRLFSNLPQGTTISIFGSMYMAYMILIEAKYAGLNVDCFIDSSPNRFNKKIILGYPIVNVANFSKYINSTDMVILSNEQDKQKEVTALLKKVLGKHKIPIKDITEILAV